MATQKSRRCLWNCLYLTAYDDAGIYKINLNNSTDVTLIPFGFTSAGKSQTGSGTCANYLFMVNDLIIGWDYQIKPDDTVVQTVGSTRLLNLGTPLFQYKEFCFGWRRLLMATVASCS